MKKRPFEDNESWVIVDKTIRRYPYEIVRMEQLRTETISASTRREVSVKSGPFSSTESKTLRIVSGTLAEGIKRRCSAVECVYKPLPEEYRKTVSLRFWGTYSVQEAIARVRSGKRLRGLPYEAENPNTVPDSTGYGITQAKKICRKFMEAVGEALGEI